MTLLSENMPLMHAGYFSIGSYHPIIVLLGFSFRQIKKNTHTHGQIRLGKVKNTPILH